MGEDDVCEYLQYFYLSSTIQVINNSQVLAVAIAGVFFLGYGKLLWMSRLLKKQELVDEEKRMKILELRRSGQFIGPKNTHEVPFGIRAIQSGIQVDGIWISGSNTPTPSILKTPYLEGSSSDSSPGLYATMSPPRKSMDISLNQPRSSPHRSRSRQSFPPPLSRVASNDRNDNVDGSERPKSRTQFSYKPRRSSQLRFDTRDESQYNEETLEHLEGRSPRKVYTHQPRGNLQKGKEVESSSDTAAAADNERSSGTSDESDTTLSNTKLPRPSPRYSTPGLGFQSSPKIAVQPLRVSMQPNQSKDGYFSIPLGSPEREKSNPFATPLFPPTEVSSPAQTPAGGSPSHRASVDTSAPLLPYTRSPSPTFVPGVGQLHMNKSVRKVNSGFEVLPAGTFGTPAEGEGRDGVRAENLDYNEESGEARKGSRKGRWSMASIRRSSNLDRR